MVIESLPKAKRIYLEKQNRIIDYKLIKELHEEEDYDINFMCKELGIGRANNANLKITNNAGNKFTNYGEYS